MIRPEDIADVAPGADAAIELVCEQMFDAAITTAFRFLTWPARVSFSTVSIPREIVSTVTGRYRKSGWVVYVDSADTRIDVRLDRPRKAGER